MTEEVDFADFSDLPNAIDERLMPLIMAEYEDLAASLRSNEELGERRLGAYLTLIAAVTAAIGLASSRFEDDATPLIGVATVAAALMTVFGIMTLRRMMVRNITTSVYMNGLRRIRAVLAQAQPGVVEVFAFPPARKPIRRERKTTFGIGNAGLLETVAAINCALLAVVVAGSIWLLARNLSLSFLAGLTASAGAWLGQMEWAKQTYKSLNQDVAVKRKRSLDAWQQWTENH